MVPSVKTVRTVPKAPKVPVTSFPRKVPMPRVPERKALLVPYARLEERQERRRIERRLEKINLEEAALALIEVAEREINVASQKLSLKVLRALKRKSESGISVKIVTSEESCDVLKFWGLRTVKCITKDLMKGTLMRLPLLAASLVIPASWSAAFSQYSLLGLIVGSSLPASYALLFNELFFWREHYAYTFIPWVLKISCITSFAELMIKTFGPRGSSTENVEVRVMDELPSTLVVVDGKHGFSSECRLSSSSCLANVYREGAYELSREFSLLWEASKPVR